MSSAPPSSTRRVPPPATTNGTAPYPHPNVSSAGGSRSGWIWILLAAAVAWPWFFYRFAGFAEHGTPGVVALLAGTAILGAAFLLSWAAEAFQVDVSQALALALLALIAVLPEYAVSVVFAWRGAADPEQAHFAVANMTGGNRLLIGLGWSAVVLVAWWHAYRTSRARGAAPAGSQSHGRHDQHVRRGGFGGTKVALDRAQAIELSALAAATLYSFVIPLKGGLGLVDAVVLFALFALYAWATGRAPSEAPHLTGPAAIIGALAPVARRLITYALFVYSALVIVLSAEPFAEGLVSAGAVLGVDEFLLVQWLAPLASEAPEFLVAILFAWRNQAVAGLRTLVASKVNQWTLLIGTLGLAYSVAAGHAADLPLDPRQAEELLLTGAQSLFALALIANFDLTVPESLFLAGTFLLQLLVPGTEARLVFAALYTLAGIGLIAGSRSRRDAIRAVPAMLRETLQRQPGRSATP